jgi:hypothetical protein
MWLQLNDSIRTALITIGMPLLLAACGGGGGDTGGSAPPVAPPAAVAPMPAQQVGYTTQTYGPSPTLISADTVSAGTASLFAWAFQGQQVGGSASPNSDGSISIVGGGSAPNAQVASARSGNSAGSFEGIAFGGGAYFEAVLKFDGWQGQSSNSNSLSGGWPAFWGMAVEHLAQTGGDQVPGEPSGYENFIEMDFMEYNIETTQNNDYVYSGSLLNWYGVLGQTCSDQYCIEQNSYASKIRQLADTVDFSQYHTYGALWVPATDTADGYLQWYFDGAPVGAQVSWSKLTVLWATPPSPFSFGIADLQHLVLILGTGSQYPMTVSSVSVWQSSGAGNLIH